MVPGKASQQVVETSGQGVLEHIDVIFPIVHGTLGEDGCLQGLLRMADLPFVGSDVLGSAVCMDKDISSACCVTRYCGHAVHHPHAS